MREREKKKKMRKSDAETMLSIAVMGIGTQKTRESMRWKSRGANAFK
jgi:hypothetical protein